MSDVARAFSEIEVRLHEGWAEVRLDRVHKRNALSWSLAGQLVDALGSVAASGREVAVLAANGPIFCAGGDLEDQRAGRPAPVSEVVQGLAEAPLFLIARVDGAVYGGGIALLAPCPVVLCAPGVEFALPAAGLVGRFPSGFFPYLEGLIPARVLLDAGVRGTPISATQAAAFGLVTSVLAPAELDAEVARWVQVALDRPSVCAEARTYWRDRVRSRLAPDG
ncbi:MAG TPA: enoyl-CoA hydratase/isomerase family protein [Acidimicrobiales bacterium]|nr:enoyl-CoA hydratase/isomerase family protein [Acidimicrobiales bacterium]